MTERIVERFQASSSFPLKSITESLTTTPFDRFKAQWKDAVEKDWYFTGFFQKFLVSACFLFTIGYLFYQFARLIL